MAGRINKDRDDDKGRINSAVIAVSGAVVGAGIAIVGAVALQDKNNRQKVKDILFKVRDQAVGYIEDMRKQTVTAKYKVEKQHLK